jgi:hypothetical protein
MLLLDQIAEKYATGVFDYPTATKQYFLPEDQIRNLITEPSIREAVPELPDDIIKWILKDSHKLFATTLKSLQGNLSLALKRFMDVGFDDSCIPITKGLLENDEDDEIPTSDTDVLERAFDRSVWGRNDLLLFTQNQWIFFAPVFKTSQYDYDLSAEHILPVIWKHEISHQGGFAAVDKVEMHQAHQKIHRKSGGESYKMVSLAFF